MTHTTANLIGGRPNAREMDMTTAQIIKATPNITRDGKARLYANCFLCRKAEMMQTMRRCAECKEWTCGECWDTEQGKCKRCAG